MPIDQSNHGIDPLLPDDHEGTLDAVILSLLKIKKMGFGNAPIAVEVVGATDSLLVLKSVNIMLQADISIEQAASNPDKCYVTFVVDPDYKIDL